MEIELGKMYQYKPEHIGKSYSKKPRTPFAVEDGLSLYESRHVLTYGNPFAKEAPWEKSYYKSNQEKILVLPCKIEKVYHPLIRSVYGTYIYATISYSREKEWKTGWLRAEWIEPLSELDETYEESMRKLWAKNAHSALLKVEEKIKTASAKPSRTPLELFEEMQARKASNRKK